MRILAWTLGFWKDAAHAQRDSDNYRGYAAWKERITRCFKPIDTFVASGTWSDPAHNPIPGTIVVNAGADWTKPYYGQRIHYGKMAFIAGLAYALNRVKDWDYLVLLDTDGLIGTLNIPKLFDDFSKRPETLLAPAWCNLIGGPVMIWKPEGAIRLIHHRPYVNFVDDDEPDMPTLWEQECLFIYRGGRWWNPWPKIPTMMQAGTRPDEEAIHWPFVCRPSATLAEPYLANHFAKCITL